MRLVNVSSVGWSDLSWCLVNPMSVALGSSLGLLKVLRKGSSNLLDYRCLAAGIVGTEWGGLSAFRYLIPLILAWYSHSQLSWSSPWVSSWCEGWTVAWGHRGARVGHPGWGIQDGTPSPQLYGFLLVSEPSCHIPPHIPQPCTLVFLT